jgi:hypothetical protein
MPLKTDSIDKTFDETFFSFLLEALAKIKSVSKGMLSASFIKKLPSTEDIPTIKHIESESEGLKQQVAYRAMLIQAQQLLSFKCVHHLSTLKELRNAWLPELAFAPWGTQARQCIELFDALQFKKTNPEILRQYIDAIDIFQRVIKDAEKSELLPHARAHKKALYKSSLLFLEDITERYAQNTPFYQKHLALIQSIKKNETDNPEDILLHASQIYHCVWKTQLSLLTRWHTLFPNDELPSLLEILNSHSTLSPEYFLKIAKKYAHYDEGQMHDTKQAWLGITNAYQKDIKQLEAFFLFATDHDIDTHAFNHDFQAFLLKLGQLKATINLISVNTTIDRLIKLEIAIKNIEQELAMLKRNLVDCSIETWSLKRLAMSQLSSDKIPHRELTPIKTALTIKDSLIKARVHAKESDTFRHAKKIFPALASAIEKNLFSSFDDERKMCSVLDDYFQLMLFYLHTEQHDKAFPYLARIKSGDDTFYKSLSFSRFEKIFEDNQSPFYKPGPTDDASTTLLFPIDEEIQSTHYKTLHYDLEKRTALLEKITTGIVMTQLDIRRHLNLLKKGLLAPSIDKSISTPVIITAEHALYQLLKAYKLSLSCDMLTKKTLSKEEEAAQNRSLLLTASMLTSAKRKWEKSENAVHQRLLSLIAEKKSHFETFAKETNEEFMRFQRFIFEDEKQIITPLIKRQHLIATLKRNIDQKQDAFQGRHDLRWKTCSQLISAYDDAIQELTDMSDFDAQTGVLNFKQRETLRDDLRLLRERTFEKNTPRLQERARTICRRIASLKQFDYLSNLTPAQILELENIEKGLSTFKTKESIRQLFLTSLNDSLQTMRQTFQRHAAQLSSFDSWLDSTTISVHHNINQSIQKEIEHFESIPPIAVKYYNFSGEAAPYTLWTHHAAMVKLGKLKLPLTKQIINNFDRKQQYMSNIVEDEIIFFKKFEALSNKPFQESNNPLFLLHLTHQVLPDLEEAIEKIKTYIANTHDYRKDKGLYMMINLHRKLVVAERSYLNGATNATYFKKEVGEAFTSTILNENSLIQLSNYENWRIIQWCRKNQYIRAIIKFFFPSHKNNLVAGASHLEQNIYRMAQKFEDTKAPSQAAEPSLARQAVQFSGIYQDAPPTQDIHTLQPTNWPTLVVVK